MRSRIGGWRTSSRRACCGNAVASTARLAPLVPRGWSSVAPELQDILRLGAYQLTGLDRVPAHAAVDTSVELAKETGGGQASSIRERGICAGWPALSRRRRLQRLAAPSDWPRSTLTRSGWYSRWVELFGLGATERLLRWNNTRPRLVLQPARQDLEALAERWRSAGIEVEPAPFGAGLVTNLTRPSELPGFETGDFFVQDPAQALLARFADLPPGAVVYDACAAPRRQDASRSVARRRTVVGWGGQPLSGPAAGREFRSGR